jgi:hypothetical protein
MVRYYRSFTSRQKTKKEQWLNALRESNALPIQVNRTGDVVNAPIPQAETENFLSYIADADSIYDQLVARLRDEESAMEFCAQRNISSGQTRTKSMDHHQSSKAMVSAVSDIAEEFCAEHGIAIDSDPQKRCVWHKGDELHITARNLDGAIASLMNPQIIWEIKEYWGKTKGGSKMSDAVYECQLVGREVREYEERSGEKIIHVVFIDGKDQWECRKSDFRRFIDLYAQGLIDHLIIGDQVETDWLPLLKDILL